MEDQDETEAAHGILAPDAVSSILVGLALSDPTLRLRVSSMISQMKAVELENVDDADVILTDTAPARPGPHLVLGDLPALQSTINGIDRKAGLDILEAAIRTRCPRVSDHPFKDRTASLPGINLRRSGCRGRRTPHRARTPGPGKARRGRIQQVDRQRSQYFARNCQISCRLAAHKTGRPQSNGRRRHRIEIGSIGSVRPTQVEPGYTNGR